MKNAPRDELRAELERLRRENARLKSLLAEDPAPQVETSDCANSEEPLSPPVEEGQPHLTLSEKVALFRNLFRGRDDVYAVRWESTKGSSGYAPACGNEWRPGICEKPRIKCADCDHRLLLPVTDQVVYEHLSGHQTIGLYPILRDDTCYLLAIDLDGREWREDARALLRSCHALGVDAALEVSRSGQGAHVWFFFAEAIAVRGARRLGAALLSYTCSRTRQLALSSYDRLFPNQDMLPKTCFGNLIALPLQRKLREQDRTVFVDENFNPYEDQWAFLRSLRKTSAAALNSAVFQATDGGHPLDVSFVSEEDDRQPWERIRSTTVKIPGPLPESLNMVFANQIFIEKDQLSQPLANRLIRLAAFQNPEFYRAQAMRLPVWNKPRIIGCAENFPRHIGLPRGCLDALRDLLTRHDIGIDIQDERRTGSPILVEFTGQLRADQADAVQAMLRQDTGVLCAPTAFGKTVTAAALIARRSVSTLVLVHRSGLLRQWQERLSTFLQLPTGGLGVIGGGKRSPSGQVDVAVMQSLSRHEDLAEMLDGYGQIIVDECHHVSAFSFEGILKRARARFVVGLTATPVRRDGHHPIIFMQCGPIRHSAAKPGIWAVSQEIWPRTLNVPEIPADAGIQEVFRRLAAHAPRNQRLAEDILAAYQEGRKILVLMQRTQHLLLIREALADVPGHCYVLHGRLPKKQRSFVLTTLAELDASAPRILLSTGSLVGEGFDHPPLDTLVLATPISWKGTLQHYAGRLHRDHGGKQDVRIYDYVEHDHP